MTPLEYLQKLGRAEADATARRARTSPAYFNQVCYGHRHASYEMAQRIVKAQARGGRMTVMSILSFKRKKRAKVARGRPAQRKATTQHAVSA